MIRVTLDHILKSRLPDLSQTIELCDEAGIPVARVMPVIDLSDCDLLTPDISDEEYARRLNSDEPRYSTSEVIRKLESL